MLKTLAAVAGATALAGTGVAMSSTPAHAAAAAAAHAKGSVYLHGTSSAAHFWSRSDCNARAAWEVGQVKKSSAAATLLPGVTGQTTHGQELRFTCYPVQGAQWSYVVAYRSATGNPVASSDRYVDIASRVQGTATKLPDAKRLALRPRACTRRRVGQRHDVQRVAEVVPEPRDDQSPRAAGLRRQHVLHRPGRASATTSSTSPPRRPPDCAGTTRSTSRHPDARRPGLQLRAEPVSGAARAGARLVRAQVARSTGGRPVESGAGPCRPVTRQSTHRARVR